MAAIIPIFLSRKQSHDQNLKNHFPKRIFNKISLKLRRTWKLHIAKMKFEKKKSVPSQNGGQNIFVAPLGPKG